MCWEQKLIILKLPAEIDVKGYVPYPLVVSHKLGKLTVEFLKKNSSGCNWLKPFFCWLNQLGRFMIKNTDSLTRFVYGIT